MLTAAKKSWADWVFFRYISRELKKHFNAFHLTNTPPLGLPDKSIIITPNHISWWDGFFIYYLQKHFFPKKRFHILMLEEQLLKYPFFRKLGAFAFNPQSLRDTFKMFDYMKTLAQNPDNLIVFYPQGVISAYEEVHLREGLQFFLKKFPVPSLIWPIHFRIQYENQKTPALYCRFGPLEESHEVGVNFHAFKRVFHDNLALLSQDTWNKKVISSLWSKQC